MMDTQSREVLFDLLRARPVSADDLKAANELASAAYWQERDIELCFGILRSAIVAARETLESGADEKSDVVQQYKGLLYNMASYGWIGWDEPGITISQDLRQLAIAAGREHFALAERMNLPPICRSRAHWLLGAALMQASEFREAHARFQQAGDLAVLGDQPGESMNARAFVLVCEAIEGTPGAEEVLQRCLEAMRSDKEAAEFATQAATALRVFRAEIKG